ncbi:hypothetical protein Hanom_Chr00s000003g01603251 [Helianthus anomalus]
MKEVCHSRHPIYVDFLMDLLTFMLMQRDHQLQGARAMVKREKEEVLPFNILENMACNLVLMVSKLGFI